MYNVYYDPEKCGLSIVGVLDQDGLDYEFNTFLVVEETQSKRLFYCQSSGCSCPTPFEEFHFSNGDDNDLNEVKRETLDSFINEVNNFPVDIDERQKLIATVKNHLKENGL